ncbi:MAG: hypothetical protein QW818_01510 [Candidatus Aenigmatarchaeota archaeon]
MAFPIENFLSPNLTNMLITFVIPFLIIFTVLLAALKRTRILGDNIFIYVIISLGLTTMIYAINPNNIFGFLTSYLFQIGVIGSIIALIGIIAVFFFTIIRKGVETASKAGGMKLESILKEERRLEQRIMKEGDLNRRLQLLQQLEDLQRKERALRYRK